MFSEPRNSPVSRAQMARQSNPYEGRWRWWYSSIADEMVKNPSASNAELAKILGRSASTISFIRASNTFQTYYAQRRTEYTLAHDAAIRDKLTSVAEKGLDVLLDKIETQKSQIPMTIVNEVTVNALDRLGFNPKQNPTTQVNVQQNTNSVTVTAADLEEARMVLRSLEAQRGAVPLPQVLDVTPETLAPPRPGSVEPAEAEGSSDLEALFMDDTGGSA